MVLVVDDNPDLVDILIHSLSRQGMIVLSAYSGRQCLERVRQHPIDVIILDAQMPEMDGFEVCAALRQMEAVCFIPIILLTGRENPETRLEAARLGVREIVVKPARGQDLFTCIRTHVEVSRKAREREIAGILTNGVLGRAHKPVQGPSLAGHEPLAEENGVSGDEGRGTSDVGSPWRT